MLLFSVSSYVSFTEIFLKLYGHTLFQNPEVNGTTIQALLQFNSEVYKATILIFMRT